jgi:hypothetical protein
LKNLELLCIANTLGDRHQFLKLVDDSQLFAVGIFAEDVQSKCCCSETLPGVFSAKSIALVKLLQALLLLLLLTVCLSQTVMSLEQLNLFHLLTMETKHVLADVDQRVDKLKFQELISERQVGAPIITPCIKASEVSFELFAVLQHQLNLPASIGVTVVNILKCLLILVKLYIKLIHFLPVLFKFLSKPMLAAVAVVLLEILLSFGVVLQNAVSNSFVVVAFAQHRLQLELFAVLLVEPLNLIDQLDDLAKAALFHKHFTFDDVHVHEIEQVRAIVIEPLAEGRLSLIAQLRLC